MPYLMQVPLNQAHLLPSSQNSASAHLPNFHLDSRANNLRIRQTMVPANRPSRGPSIPQLNENLAANMNPAVNAPVNAPRQPVLADQNQINVAAAAVPNEFEDNQERPNAFLLIIRLAFMLYVFSAGGKSPYFYAYLGLFVFLFFYNMGYMDHLRMPGKYRYR